MKSFVNCYKEYFTGKIEYTRPKRSEKEFQGYLKLQNDPKGQNIGFSNLILRGSQIKYSDWIIGLVISKGKEITNLSQLQNTSSDRKFKNFLNRFMQMSIVWIIFGILTTSVWKTLHDQSDIFQELREPWIIQLIFAIQVYATQAPIIVYSMIDFVYLLQKYYIQKKYKQKGTEIVINNPESISNLCHVDYAVFSQSGTITKKDQEDIIGIIYDGKFFQVNDQNGCAGTQFDTNAGQQIQNTPSPGKKHSPDLMNNTTQQFDMSHNKTFQHDTLINNTQSHINRINSLEKFNTLQNIADQTINNDISFIPVNNQNNITDINNNNHNKNHIDQKKPHNNHNINIENPINNYFFSFKKHFKNPNSFTELNNIENNNDNDNKLTEQNEEKNRISSQNQFQQSAQTNIELALLGKQATIIQHLCGMENNDEIIQEEDQFASESKPNSSFNGITFTNACLNNEKSKISDNLLVNHSNYKLEDIQTPRDQNELIIHVCLDDQNKELIQLDVNSQQDNSSKNKEKQNDNLLQKSPTLIDDIGKQQLKSVSRANSITRDFKTNSVNLYTNMIQLKQFKKINQNLQLFQLNYLISIITKNILM